MGNITSSTLPVLFTALVLALHAGGVSGVPHEQQVARQLIPGQPVEENLSAGQFHTFTIAAAPNQYLQLIVDQRGIDVIVTLFAPDGTKLTEADRTSTFGPETILGVIQSQTELRVEVRPVDESASTGKYQILIKELRAVRDEDNSHITKMTAAFDAVADATELKAKADVASLKLALEKYNYSLRTWRAFGELHWEATTLNDLGTTYERLGEHERALESHGQALAIFKGLGNRTDEALTLYLTAEVHNRVGAAIADRKKALNDYKLALSLFQALGDRAFEVNTLNNLGLVYNSLGEHATSLKFFDQALPVSRTLRDRNGEAKTLYNLGRAYDYLGEMQKSIEHYDRALPLFRAAGNTAGESRTLHNMGSVYHSFGEMQKALELYEQSFKLDRATGDRIGEGASLNDIGGVYSDLGEKQKALEYYNQALPIRRSAGDREGEAATLNNIGGVYLSWGELQKSLNFYNEALVVSRAVGDRSGEATTLNNIGQIYLNLGEPEKAIEFYGQSVSIYRALEDRAGQATSLNNLGSVHEDLGDRGKAAELYLQALSLQRVVGNRGGEANTLNNLASILKDGGERTTALEYLNNALSLFGSVGDPSGQATVLNNLGDLYSEAGEADKALKSYNKALVINRLIGDRSGEAIVLGNLLFEWKKSRKSALAVFYGKHAINLLQGLRGNVQALDKAVQKSYLARIEPTYRFLADLLISENRLAEAQQTLNLFKDQQFFDFNSNSQPQTSSLTLTKREELMLQRYEQTTNRYGAVGQKVAEIRRKLGKRQPASNEVLEIKRLETDLESSGREFTAFLNDLENDAAWSTSEKQIEIPDLIRFQQSLSELGRQTRQVIIAVYTLRGEETFRALIISPTGIAAASQPMKLETLDDKALQLWGLMQSENYDPRPLAQELYLKVFKGIEAQLPKDTATILWSLDGNLRYLPMAALYDGKQFLVERYNHVVFTRADSERFQRPVSAHWTGVGLGSSKAHTVEVLGDKISFNALPGVSEELRTLFKQKGSPVGVLEGEILPDARFTKPAMLAALKQRRPLVHISSHFSFRPGDEARSFLLLGDGTAFTLEEMKSQMDLFSGVELLTLSACNTAAQQAGASGREIDGFAELAQRLGAGSVMATLWSVADNSTPWLMREFYQKRQGGNGMSKAAALRQAQLALLNGTAQANPLPEGRKGSAAVKIVDDALAAKRDAPGTRADIVFVAAKDAPAFKRDPNRPFAHPYYWAPFILVGNFK